MKDVAIEEVVKVYMGSSQVACLLADFLERFIVLEP